MRIRTTFGGALLGALLVVMSACAVSVNSLPPTRTPPGGALPRARIPEFSEATLVPTATAAAPAAEESPTPEDAMATSASVLALQSEVERVYAEACGSVVNITSRAILYGWFNQPMPQEGSGSGFLFDEFGHVVTNYHVISGAAEVIVSLADGSSYMAEIVGADPTTDLAVLRIDADDLPSPLPLADSDELRVGQFVVAIGNPFGLDQTLTFGVISSLGRVIETPNSRFVGEAIQTDAPINPGNSGGPLLDLTGRVIGVNSQIISTTGASAGIGFAVSSNSVRRIVPELIARGFYPHPWLGVTVMSLSEESVRAYNRAGADIAVSEGVLVLVVERGSPAEAAGLRGGQRVIDVPGGGRLPAGGDVIVALDGEPIRNDRDLRIFLDTRTRVGDVVLVSYVRDGQQLGALITLTARP